MQSGKAGYNHWRIDWDVLQGSGRWENPLMGWASTYVASCSWPSQSLTYQGRLHVGHHDEVQDQGGCHSLCASSVLKDAEHC